MVPVVQQVQRVQLDQENLRLQSIRHLLMNLLSLQGLANLSVLHLPVLQQVQLTQQVLAVLESQHYRAVLEVLKDQLIQENLTSLLALCFLVDQMDQLDQPILLVQENQDLLLVPSNPEDPAVPMVLVNLEGLEIPMVQDPLIDQETQLLQGLQMLQEDLAVPGFQKGQLVHSVQWDQEPLFLQVFQGFQDFLLVQVILMVQEDQCLLEDQVNQTNLQDQGFQRVHYHHLHQQVQSVLVLQVDQMALAVQGHLLVLVDLVNLAVPLDQQSLQVLQVLEDLNRLEVLPVLVYRCCQKVQEIQEGQQIQADPCCQ